MAKTAFAAPSHNNQNYERTKMAFTKQIEIYQILEIINLYRGVILDTIEIEISDPEQWKYVRSRLLKILGDRGLEGQIRMVLGHNLTD